MKRTLAGLFLFTLLISVFVSAYRIQFAKAQGTTIYINRDGSISPSSLPISTVDNVTYTFTGNMSYPAYNGIVVERSNIVIDGAGYAVQGNQSGNGLTLNDVINVTVENVNVENFQYGILLFNSDNSTVGGNNVSANSWDGIWLNSSSNDIVSGNDATASSYFGITLDYCSNNIVSGNDATANNNDGIRLLSSNDNVVSANNVTANGEGISVDSSSNNCIFSGNDITSNGNGIGIYYSSNSTVSGNNVSANSWTGILIEVSSNNIVCGNDASANYDGITFNPCSNSTVNGNNVTANRMNGIELDYSSSNNVSDNEVTENTDYGVDLYSSSNNNIIGNDFVSYKTATAYNTGIYLEFSSNNNAVYHNYFTGNGIPAGVGFGVGNVWDNGYPSGGNYWSDYNGTDVYSGPYQNVTGSDGIGDTPYTIDRNSTDRYPLMGMFSDFNVSQGADVQTVSNSTVSSFQFNGTALLFTVTGENGTTGFCRISFPNVLIKGTVTVFVNGTEVPYTVLPASNSSESYLYFTYSYSTEQVTIIPEFQPFIFLPLFTAAIVLEVKIYRKKPSRTQET